MQGRCVPEVKTTLRAHQKNTSLLQVEVAALLETCLSCLTKHWRGGPLQTWQVQVHLFSSFEYVRISKLVVCTGAKGHLFFDEPIDVSARFDERYLMYFDEI